ncbi:CAMK family protein kinase [Tritrichomonas foetus]|uniref:CAMK family protein kinase n=1 Tax=Tritrichomonas foetus TaxID=1144522 RepID=A0A1J4KUG7_9EUKA|nr:CAMK family protein kinase [Tritrichomonas foetus]|eukprot:OHT14921.1 CAMK family protein kinase [Tritrichomonas foetus]
MMIYFGEIPQQIFRDIREIGSGSFSNIFSATYRKTQTKVALKAFEKKHGEEMVIQNEIDIHKSLHHPLIAEFFSDFETDHLKIIILELVEGITMLDKVNKEERLGVIEAQFVFVQLMTVFDYLHIEKNIAHRDLKLENIMIDSYGHIRVIDFGFSSNSTNLMTTLCGSIPYCAPEIFTCEKFSKSADIWSLGIILFALVSGRLPFYDSNMNNMVASICTSEPEYPQMIPTNCLDILSKLLIKDPENRITIKDIERHSFVLNCTFSHIDMDALFVRSEFKSVEDHILSRQNYAFVLNQKIENELLKMSHCAGAGKLRSSSNLSRSVLRSLNMPIVVSGRRMSQITQPRHFNKMRKRAVFNASNVQNIQNLVEKNSILTTTTDSGSL